MVEDLHRRALLLSYFTVGYNVLEGVISIVAGAAAGSVALVGFGIDSAVESLSGTVMIWRFRKHGIITEEEEEGVERKALRLIGCTFFILGAYVLFEAVKKLFLGETAEKSLIGIIVALVSIVVMPLLFIVKYRTGKAVGSRSLVADSKETLACFFLSVALLLGLGLNYVAGLWQADPVTGLFIVAYLFKEGYEMVFGDS